MTAQGESDGYGTLLSYCTSFFVAARDYDRNIMIAKDQHTLNIFLIHFSRKLFYTQ